MEDIITRARAFVANHAQEPRYGAVDEMVKGLIDRIERLEESEEQLLTERDSYQENIDTIHAATGCEREWSNLHDCGECAVENVGNALTELDKARETITAIDDAVHGRGTNHTGLAHVVAQALSDAARAVEVAQMNHDRAYDALAVGLGLSEEHEARESLDALVKCALESIRHIEGANDELLKQLTAEQARGDNLSAEIRSLHRELAASENKHTKAVLDGGKVMDALVRRAHEIMTERDEALAMAEAAMREGLSECERLRGVIDAVRAIIRVEHYLRGWAPATVCEACKGDEITGCICGMVPGTQPRSKP